MANLSNLQPNPDKHEHYDIQVEHPAPLWSVLIGVLLALIFFGLVVALIITGNQAVQYAR